MKTPEPTVAELRAAFKRAAWLRFHGWTFAKAISVPAMFTALRHAALARRQREPMPTQPRLI